VFASVPCLRYAVCVRSCSGVVSLKNGSLMTAIKILLYTVYTVMLTDDDDDDDEL